MEFLSTTENGGMLPAMPPGVTPIREGKQQKRASRTLSKAVSLHLEGKLENAARLLTKAIDDGEKDPACFPRSAIFNMRCAIRGRGRRLLAADRNRDEPSHRLVQSRRLPGPPEELEIRGRLVPNAPLKSTPRAPTHGSDSAFR